jgi:hypothetical protein
MKFLPDEVAKDAQVLSLFPGMEGWQGTGEDGRVRGLGQRIADIQRDSSLFSEWLRR